MEQLCILPVYGSSGIPAVIGAGELAEPMISLYKYKIVRRSNATLIFTTHYCEVPDQMGRQDII